MKCVKLKLHKIKSVQLTYTFTTSKERCIDCRNEKNFGTKLSHNQTYYQLRKTSFMKPVQNKYFIYPIVFLDNRHKIFRTNQSSSITILYDNL